MRVRSLVEKITYPKIILVMAGLFFVSLLPILYCTFFDYASGDDLWEGASAYRVLADHGSTKDFIMAVYTWAKTDYIGWRGNWSSIILCCLEPSIWGEKVYCITPWIGLIALAGGTSYFLFYFLKKQLVCDNSFLLVVSLITCFFSIQYMPNIRSGIFWYAGMINYVAPYGVSLVSFVWIDKFLETGRKRYCVFATLFFAYLGGAGYIPIVFAFEILFFIIAANFLSGGHERKARGYWLLLPFFLLVVGFIFSAVSPGNAVRGGESYYFSLEKVFNAILESIKQGFKGMIHWFLSVRPLILAVPLLILVAWELIDVTKVRWKLKHPVWVLLFLFLISCSVYAPGIYAESEVSGGVPDTIYFIFLLTCVFGIVYLICCIKKRIIEKGWKMPGQAFMQKVRIAALVGEILFCIIAGKHLIGNMAGYMCMDYIKSGQLRDFEFQMQERLKILHDPEIEDVILPEMNNEQGPFMHMPIIKDPEAFTNQATARFYGKKSVIAIPRTEYYELYGYPGEGSLSKNTGVSGNIVKKRQTCLH